MSVESLFATANASPQRSGPLQRRLGLLKTVLPYFLPAIMRSYYSEKRFNREFWTNFLTPCLAMEMAKWPFDCIDNKHAELVKLVIEKLEAVMGMKEEDIAEEFKSSSFPRLETVRKLIKETTDDSEDILIELVKPGTAEGCSVLVDLLRSLSSIMKDNTEQPPPEDVRMTSKSKPLMAPLLRNLFSTISEYWRCTCKTPHKAALLLFTNRTLPKNDSLACFTVLLSQAMVPRRTKRWHEAGITICEQLPKSTVRISFPDEKRDEKNPVTDLCAAIKKSTTRLNLNIEGASLSSQAETDPQMKNFENCELVTFTKGFLENESELQIYEKVCLAVILSYAFLDFCGKPWFPRGWTKDSLYLMQYERTLFLQPFLVTTMGTKQSEPELPISATDSRTETLLLHGILLMEIFEQASLRTSSRPDGKFTSLKDMAQEWVKSIEWGVCERYCQVVKICIQGTLIDSTMISSTALQSRADPSRNSLCNTVETSDEDFARLFCERILAPLEADFISQWPNKDPDEVILTIKLPSIKQEPNPYPKLAPAALTLSSQQNPKPRPQTSFRRSIQPALTLTPLSLKHTNLKFFDVIDDPDTTQVKGALRWFENFDIDDIQKSLPKRAGIKENRTKIAVLDTGINLKNVWISQRRGRIRCWPSELDCEDKDGHGTHVAHLLLRLAPHAHLRICKVSKTRLLKDADIKQIADAIVHFSIGKERVDIINLSFGFPRYITRLRPILTAIRAARDNGVVIFTAAGNDGGNKGVFWPAALHDSGDVIRINSSDGNGVPSGFNPDPEVGRRICTLGEGVPSCQPNPSQPGEMIYRSGTSFATPIAASIAAIILGFMDNVDTSANAADFLDLKGLLPRLRTARGMERVLCELCESKRSGFSYITPWRFLERPEKIRIPLILDILSGVPESPVLC